MSDTNAPSYEALLLPLEVVRNHVEAAKDQLRALQAGAEARFGPVMAAGVRLQVQAALAALDLTYAPPRARRQASGGWCRRWRRPCGTPKSSRTRWLYWCRWSAP
jgi:hypothetical protein